MPLPKIDVPIYELTLPLSKKKIKYRPFLVKEQRNLLMAMESSDTDTIHNSIRHILNNCTLTENIDIDKLPIIDIEYYFINLRAKSVSEIVDTKYRCNNEVNDKPCGNVMDVQINLSDINVEGVKDNEDIELTNKLIIKMKYPEFYVVKDSVNIESITQITFNMIAESIEYIFDGEQFYYANEAQPGEMLEFVESLSQTQFEKLEEFFNDLPKLKKDVNIKCNKCGFDHHIEVEGLESFFV
jgi:hypothetical protein